VTPRSKSTPLRDISLYEQMIDHGIAAADRRFRAIDHVTARRIALMLVPRSQENPKLMRGLIRFAKSGYITEGLRDHLRPQARSPRHPNHTYAAKLLQYAMARGASRGSIGNDFGAICDQIDRADAMLIEMRERAERSHRLPQPTSPDASGQDPMALARYDPISRTWGFILDDTTAKAAVHAITVDAFEREARTREVQEDSRQFPQNSYGRQNRRIIAAREAGITARLRAVERAYRAALDPGAVKAIGLTRTLPAMDRASDRERELE
jgi:hypothetical protein